MVLLLKLHKHLAKRIAPDEILSDKEFQVVINQNMTDIKELLLQ